jgi:L-asparaginase II
MNNLTQTLHYLTPSPTDFVEIAVLERAGFVESRHRGIAAVTSADGKLIDHLGSPKRVIYPRSSIKPLQAVAMQRAGLVLADDDWAIVSASHHANEAHMRLVSKVLAGAGLDDSALQCPVAWPADQAARSAAKEPTKVAFNCSGKHAGFLATCVAAGWDTATYLETEHPLQVLIREILEEYSGERILHSTIDGCGAPLHMMTVEGLARAIGAFAVRNQDLAASMLRNPWIVGSEDNTDAALMKEGIVCKLGAEGVLVAATEDGHGLAVKVADGSHRPAPFALVGLLQRNALIDDAAAARILERVAVPVTGGAQTLGGMRAAF